MMRYRDGRAFRQALEQRLRDAANGDHARLVNLRRRIIFYRLLTRLTAAAADRWLLKGGLALDLRLPDRARATRDIDLDWTAPAHELLDGLIDAARHDAGDHLAFGLELAGALPDGAPGGHRFRVETSLAGRPFDAFRLDVGLRHRAEPIDRLKAPDVLAFADVETATVPAISLETQVAEKVHAYTRTYERQRRSTRAKDLVDLALITGLPLAAERLRCALTITFRERATHPLPATLPRPPMEWRVPFGALAESVGLPKEMLAAHAEAARLLDPVLAGDIERGRWDPERRRWIAQGS